MEKRKVGRPRKRNDGVILTVYIEKDISDYLHENVGYGHISDFVNKALRSAIQEERRGKK